MVRRRLRPSMVIGLGRWAAPLSSEQRSKLGLSSFGMWMSLMLRERWQEEQEHRLRRKKATSVPLQMRAVSKVRCWVSPLSTMAEL